MIRSIEYQGYDIRRSATAVALTLGALFTASACSAEGEGTEPKPAPTTSQSFEAEPEPTEKAEFNPTATGTYEQFAAAMDTPPFGKLTGTITTTDRHGEDKTLTCDEILAWDVGQGIFVPDFNPATDYSVCSGDNVTTDMRALSAFFSNIETFVNSGVFPEGTDADIKVGITTEVGRAIYDQYDGYRNGLPGYENVQDTDEIVDIVAFNATQAYRWSNGMHEGHELTEKEIRDITLRARDQVYGIGQTPEDLVGAAAGPDQAAAHTNGELVDRLLDKAQPAANDQTKLMDINGMELPCHAIVGAPECTEEAQGYFNVVLDTYESVSEQTGVDPAHTGLIMFYAGVLIDRGTGDMWTANDLIAMASQNVFTQLQPEEILAVGEALGASDRYPELFGAEQVTR